MNKKQRSELEERMSRWIWDAVEEDRTLFILNEARKDYEKVVGESGIGLARWQATALELVGVGTRTEVAEAQLAKDVEIVEAVFSTYPEDSVGFAIGQTVIEDMMSGDVVTRELAVVS